MARTLVATRTTKQARSIENELAFISKYCGPAKVAEKRLSAEEAEYEIWKRANGLDRRLSRQEYEDVFNIYA